MQTGRFFQGRFAGVALAGVLLVGLVSTLAVHGQTNADGSSKVALVNIEKILNSLDEVKIAQTRIQASGTQRQNEINELNKQIKEANDKLDLMPLNDVNRRDEAVKLMQLNAIAAAKAQAYQAIINIEKGDLFKDAHGHIMDACKQYAEKNGIELVMVDDRVLQFLENDPVEKVSSLIAQKRILYGAPSIDITDAILTMMNNQFQANGGKAPAKTTEKKKP
ncbi:MAG: OmpH family outer membrane protein [Phycisphaerales bacterium]|nr:OmpH family outer membrane protein [Planctomycetota bacterium]